MTLASCAGDLSPTSGCGYFFAPSPAAALAGAGQIGLTDEPCAAAAAIGREVIDIVTRGVMPQQLDQGKQRSDSDTTPIPAVALLGLEVPKDKAVQGERVPHDVILMDVSMEVMDGLQGLASRLPGVASVIVRSQESVR